ncbi:MAG: hypothetical protein FWE36_04765 [Erysipelotrichales bacterium]|nr:hypothetical protein [Erysipelotrichales bacterium]
MSKFYYNGVEMTREELEPLMRENKVAFTADGENFIVRMLSEEERSKHNNSELLWVEREKIQLEIEIEYLERKLGENFSAFSTTLDKRELLLEKLKAKLANLN